MASWKPSVTPAGKSLYVQTGSVQLKVFVGRCGVLGADCCGRGQPSSTGVAVSTACLQLRRSSKSVCVCSWKTSVAWCTPWKNFCEFLADPAAPKLAAYTFNSHGVFEKLRKWLVKFTDELRELETPSMLSNCLHKSAFQSASLNVECHTTCG